MHIIPLAHAIEGSKTFRGFAHMDMYIEIVLYEKFEFEWSSTKYAKLFPFETFYVYGSIVPWYELLIYMCNVLYIYVCIALLYMYLRACGY